LEVDPTEVVSMVAVDDIGDRMYQR